MNGYWILSNAFSVSIEVIVWLLSFLFIWCITLMDLWMLNHSCEFGMKPTCWYRGSRGGLVSKESSCSVGDLGSISGSGRSPGEGNGSPLQYSCQENSMDKGAWWATIHAVTKSGTRRATNIFTSWALKVLWTISLLRVAIRIHGKEFPGGPVVKNLPCNAGDLIPGPGRFCLPRGN